MRVRERASAGTECAGTASAGSAGPAAALPELGAGGRKGSLQSSLGTHGSPRAPPQGAVLLPWSPCPCSPGPARRIPRLPSGLCPARAHGAVRHSRAPSDSALAASASPKAEGWSNRDTQTSPQQTKLSRFDQKTCGNKPCETIALPLSYLIIPITFS